MNTGKPTRSDRIDSVARGTLALALIAAVVWALADGGGIQQSFAYFSSLKGP